MSEDPLPYFDDLQQRNHVLRVHNTQLVEENRALREQLDAAMKDADTASAQACKARTELLRAHWTQPALPTTTWLTPPPLLDLSAASQVVDLYKQYLSGVGDWQEAVLAELRALRVLVEGVPRG